MCDVDFENSVYELKYISMFVLFRISTIIGLSIISWLYNQLIIKNVIPHIKL